MIKNISFKNFVGFEEYTNAEPFSRVNVIVGTNDSGKTALLKMMYAVSKALEDHRPKKGPQYQESFKERLSLKIRDVFQPRKGGIGELVKKGSHQKLSAYLEYVDIESRATINTVNFSFGEATNKNIQEVSPAEQHLNPLPEEFNAVFLPSKEVLTAFAAIASSREQLGILGFDDTYYDLIKDLRLPTQKGRVSDSLVKVNARLEELFEGRVEQQINPGAEVDFVFKKGNTQYSMPLTAEGIKKIGILTTLIRNRKLGKGTVLFMDEPETALHPKAVRELAEIIFQLGRAKVQIFLSTHNYFLIEQLSIIAREKTTNINFVSLEKGPQGDISVTTGNLKNGMPSNPIINEALALYDAEVRLAMGVQ